MCRPRRRSRPYRAVAPPRNPPQDASPSRPRGPPATAPRRAPTHLLGVAASPGPRGTGHLLVVLHRSRARRRRAGGRQVRWRAGRLSAVPLAPRGGASGLAVRGRGAGVRKRGRRGPGALRCAGRGALGGTSRRGGAARPGGPVRRGRASRRRVAGGRAGGAGGGEGRLGRAGGPPGGTGGRGEGGSVAMDDLVKCLADGPSARDSGEGCECPRLAVGGTRRGAPPRGPGAGAAVSGEGDRR